MGFESMSLQITRKVMIRHWKNRMKWLGWRLMMWWIQKGRVIFKLYQKIIKSG